jgi:hypothetical protein
MSASASVVRVGGETTRLPPTGCERDVAMKLCDHRIRLHDNLCNDISGIRIVAKPRMDPELTGMSLRIGSQRSLYWDRAALESGEELLGRVLCDEGGVVPTSLSQYMHTDLVFHYDADSIVARATWKDVQVEEANGGDAYWDDDDGGGIREFRDEITGQIRRGTLVAYGDSVCAYVRDATVVADGVEVGIPEIDISFVVPQPSDAASPNASVRFWQRIDYEPTENMRTVWGVRHTPDGATYVRNELRFMEGMAGVSLSL